MKKSVKAKSWPRFMHQHRHFVGCKTHSLAGLLLWTASPPSFQEGDQSSGSLPSAFAGVGTGEEESASRISCCLHLKFLFSPLDSQADYVETWIWSYFKDVKLYDNAHCWMLSKVQSNQSKKARRLGKLLSLLSWAHIQKYVPKPILRTFGFPITARLHKQESDHELFFRIFVDGN